MVFIRPSMEYEQIVENTYGSICNVHIELGANELSRKLWLLDRQARIYMSMYLWRYVLRPFLQNFKMLDRLA